MVRYLLFAASVLGLSVSTATAERLTLSFLPPDLPPSNVCNVDAERFDEDETQIVEEGGSEESLLDDKARLRYLAQDIRNLRRDDPEGALPFILELIDRRAELDPRYDGFAADFDRVDSYLAGGALDALADTGLIEALTSSLDEMGWTEIVRLSRFYLNGIGVPQDREFAMRLILDQAYLGNANALLEVLRMQLRGDDVAEWSLPPNETARLAFGGIIGKTNRGLCSRAERMAREYLDGDLLTPNADLAYAWRKFAADMGGAKAAWRVVEYHLSATGTEKNEAVLRHYLQQALANGAVVLPEMVDDIIAQGAKTEQEIRRFLGANTARVGSSKRQSAVPFLQMDLRLTTKEIAQDGEYLRYLHEIAELPHVHGKVLTRLADEVALRKGQWTAEDEIAAHLERAVGLGDPDARGKLAKVLLRKRQDPAILAKVEVLLMQSVDRDGEAQALKALDRFYRCQVPDAPRLREATFWADAYRAVDVSPVTISATDVARLDPRAEPEAIARIQSLALENHGAATANLLQYMQSDPNTTEAALRHWADRVSRSDVALEDYVLQEFELALTANERTSAIELFRRAFLDVGASISLELALVLIEHAGRDPTIARQIIDQLEIGAARGQGAAIRLLQRLTKRDAREVYAEYASVIESRGDFLAHTFAAPHLSDAEFFRYMDRAISLMNCSTKDVTELVEAFAQRGLDDESAHWVRIGLALERGNTLSQLRLSDRQMDSFDRGVSVAEDTVAAPASIHSNFDDLRRSYLAVSDPESATFDANAAATHLAAIFVSANRPDYLWALRAYRQAEQGVRTSTDSKVDVWSGLRVAADSGDAIAQFELGMLTRMLAQSREDLASSTKWLSKSANAGNGDAMFEYAHAIAFGIGRPADPKLALIWLDRAERLHPKNTHDLRSLLTAMVSE